MNEKQTGFSLKLGILALGLIPVFQLCKLASYGLYMKKRGIDLSTVIMDPPAVFAMFPPVAVVFAVAILAWVIFLGIQKSPGLIHVCIYYAAVTLFSVYLTFEIMRTAGTGTWLWENAKHNSQDQAKDNAKR